ncbi:hypothetical protein L228DRAFT_237601 [Xylona heveae TC161]|uniref:Phosphatidate phosphatase APP1 catalytic domain-containing protein n=1 Tax=Xylona heveae (strain CBS 132557 / TC161) TaxID=1328760 RepID=A0A165ICB7_XYLHT|nr:hypothetical protein L228DRAFT_237601 [Xylona heveae TC161]KZF24699.1 hypothetical protein L228DRAFT_237601 [Xylona heveae TC161]
MEETPQERQTRKTGDFPKVEHELPAMPSRMQAPFLDSASSYLGSYNPFARPVTAEDTVWLLDNTAYRPVSAINLRRQPFQAEFIVAYFRRNSGKWFSKFVADVAEKVRLGEPGEDEAAVEALIRKRVQPMFDTILPARTVNILLHNGSVAKLGPSGRNGVSNNSISLGGDPHPDNRAKHIAVIDGEEAHHVSMTTHFAEPEGWGFISDIDDSIKVTLTPSPIGILRTTFALPPEPIAGMPELYSHINQLLNPSWFYLSASPYNLYPFLHSFRREYYPDGTIILRDASWMDLAGFLASLTQGTQAYKVDRMEKIHSWLPNRKFICLGDSTQSDPEAYAEVYRKYPHWIRAIFIRKVTDIFEMNETDKNEDKRFEEAFKHVPRDVWHVFTDPSELYARVNILTKK